MKGEAKSDEFSDLTSQNIVDLRKLVSCLRWKIPLFRWKGFLRGQMQGAVAYESRQGLDELIGL